MRSDPNLQLRKAFPGQPVLSAKVSSDFAKLTTTVTTGVIAEVINIDNTLVTSFFTRFAGWQEYRIIKAVLKVTSFSSTNPGRIVLYLDEQDATTPNLADSQARRYVMFSAADVSRVHTLLYTPHDLADLNYTLIGNNSPTLAYFKIFTDNSDLGSSIIATDYLSWTVDLTFQFRGFQV